MESRLLLAKKLLNPKNSVLIVTIDEKEYLHLGCLLEEMFPEANIQMVSSVIAQSGVARNNSFYRTNEFIYIVQLGNSAVQKLPLSEEWKLGKKKVKVLKVLFGINLEELELIACEQIDKICSILSFSTKMPLKS